MLYLCYFWGGGRKTLFKHQLSPSVDSQEKVRSRKVTSKVCLWVSKGTKSRWEKRRTYRPSEKFQPSELESVPFSHSKLRDYDEAEGYNEWENVELQKPPQKVEVGQDAGSKLASDDLQRLLPQANGIEQLRQVVLGSPVYLALGWGLAFPQQIPTEHVPQQQKRPPGTSVGICKCISFTPQDHPLKWVCYYFPTFAVEGETHNG